MSINAVEFDIVSLLRKNISISRLINKSKSKLKNRICFKLIVLIQNCRRKSKSKCSLQVKTVLVKDSYKLNSNFENINFTLNH